MPKFHFLFFFPSLQTLGLAFKSLKACSQFRNTGQVEERKGEETQSPLDRYTQMQPVYSVRAPILTAEYANAVPQHTYFLLTVCLKKTVTPMQAGHNRKHLICLLDYGSKGFLCLYL